MVPKDPGVSAHEKPVFLFFLSCGGDRLDGKWISDLRGPCDRQRIFRKGIQIRRARRARGVRHLGWSRHLTNVAAVSWDLLTRQRSTHHSG